MDLASQSGLNIDTVIANWKAWYLQSLKVAEMFAEIADPPEAVWIRPHSFVPGQATQNCIKYHLGTIKGIITNAGMA